MSTRIHIVVSDGLLAAVDGVRGDVPRSAWLRRVIEREVGWRDSNRRAVEQALEGAGSLPTSSGGREAPSPAPAEQPVASEQALGSPEVPVGVRGRVPALPPAEQLRDVVVPRRNEALGSSFDGATVPAFSSRVRSSSEARPFRPAPKKGEK